MDYSRTIKFLHKRFNKGYSNAEYYNHISLWLDWYKGKLSNVHTIKTSNGITTSSREMYRLNMAKRVCEDWTSQLLNKDYFIYNYIEKE